MAATTAITTAALSNVFISASQCPEGNLLKTGPECKRTRAKARDYIWQSTFGMAPGWSGSTFGMNVVAGFSPCFRNHHLPRVLRVILEERLLVLQVLHG